MWEGVMSREVEQKKTGKPRERWMASGRQDLQEEGLTRDEVQEKMEGKGNKTSSTPKERKSSSQDKKNHR